jgi:hypothetical protein
MVEPWSAVPEWIAKAEGDWEALEILLTSNSPGLRDAVVFHAQQCVEKLLKARLIQVGQPVDKIHDLAALASWKLWMTNGAGMIRNWLISPQERCSLATRALRPQLRNKQNWWSWPAM